MNLKEAQLNDPSIAWILEAKSQSVNRPAWETIDLTSIIVKTYWNRWDQLHILNGALYHRWESDDGKQIRRQVVLPKSLTDTVIIKSHAGKTSGHLGVKRKFSRVKFHYFWYGMRADVRSCLRKCERCAKRKSPPKRNRAPLQQMKVCFPMQRVALDIMGPIPETEDGNRWILVVGDYLTKWIEAYPLVDTRAETVAKKLVTEFICRFGVPSELHSDQGRNFEANVFAGVCDLSGIHKTRTTPYNLKSDGLIERFNRTLINIIATMIEPNQKQKDWDLQLPYATFAYRSTLQESTGETPNMMMLGRETSLPIDLINEFPKHELGEELDYAEELRDRIQSAHERASEHLKASARRQKQGYDRKVSGRSLKEGDFVWVYNFAKKKGVCPKLESRWEGPSLILDKLSDVVYRLQRSKHSKKRVIHYDRLKIYEGEPIKAWTQPNLELEVLTPPTAPTNGTELEDVFGNNSVPEEGERIEVPPFTNDFDVNNVRGSLHDQSLAPRGERYPQRRHRLLPVRYR